MPPLNYTAAELASLAPEERAALEAADGTDKEFIEQLAGGSDTVEGAGADTAAGAAGADTAAGAAGADTTTGAAGADTVAGAATAATQAADTPAPGPHPVVYRAQVSADVAKDMQAQKDAIATARTEKRQALMKLNDGEIDAEEYGRIEDAADAKIDAANDKIRALDRSQARAEVSVELTQQQQMNAWKRMLTDYSAKAKTDLGIDYQADEGKRGEFNSLVKAFAQEAADRGMSDDNDMAASRWALDQAASIIAVRYPKAAAAPAAGAAGAAAGAAPAATPAPTPAPAAARAGIPTTLGAMPAAAAAPIADDLLQKAATLEGDALEIWMASLPPADAKRLMASAQ